MVVNIAKQPTKALKAVWLPMKMQPRIVQQQPQTKVALKGLRWVGETRPTIPEKGVASSRARVHSMRPQVT